MKVLAIGATGFIGGHVVPLLFEAGHEVALLDRGSSSPRQSIRARQIVADRNHLRDARGEVERFAPDVALDLILYTELQARELVEVCRGCVGRVVALSSADVYRNYDGLRGAPTARPDPTPLLENAALRENHYPYRGETSRLEYANDYEKILVEQVLGAEAELPATLLRLPAVYGPGDRQHRLRPYVRRMVDGRDFILLGEGQSTWRWTRGFVGNVAAAVVLAVSDSPSGSVVYNVGDEPTLTEVEWVRRIGLAMGWSGRVVVVPPSELPPSLRPPLDWAYHLWTSSERIRSDLGYAEPVSLDEALQRTVEWEREVLEAAAPVDYSLEDAALASRSSRSRESDS